MEGNFDDGLNRGWRLERRRNVEMARLRNTIAQVLAIPIGDPGDPKAKDARFRQLELLLSREPQRNDSGELRYLVTSGFAVEIITGFERDHHDLDLVIMDPSNVEYWELMGTDNVTPGQYWANMKFDASFLERYARKVMIRKGISTRVEVVHPAIILVQKSSYAFGRPPRSKDEKDVAAIVRHWREVEGYTRDWNPLIRHSIDALPPEQADNTVQRIRTSLSI